MNYFKYHYNERMGKVWSLFSKMAETQQSKAEFGLSCDYNHTLEIVKAAMSGSILLNEDSVETFNLDAYEYACKENDKIGRIQSVEKELFIVDNFSKGESETKVGFGDVSSNHKSLQYYDKKLSDMLDNKDFNDNLKRLLNIRTTVMVEHGLDIVQSLISALKGVEDAIQNIKIMTEKDEKIKDIIYSLCSSAETGKLLNSLVVSA